MKSETEQVSYIDTPEGRKWIHGVLKMHETSITFTKKDGTERTMLCSLMENIIPDEKKPKNVNRNKPQESIAVFDLEKQEWRSFRFDSVKSVEFDIG